MTRIVRAPVLLIGGKGEEALFYIPSPLSEQNFEFLIRYLRFLKPVLVPELEETEIAGIRDVGLCGVKIIPLQEEQKIEWAFEPKLGYEIEPTLTKEEFEDALTRVAAPKR